MTYGFDFGYPLVDNPFSSQEKTIAFCLLLCPQNLTWKPLGWGVPKICLHRNMGCIPHVARVLPTAAHSQKNCLSLFFFWYLWEWLQCLSHPWTPRRCSVLPGIFTGCPNWNLTRHSKRSVDCFVLFCFILDSSMVRSWPNGKLISRARQKLISGLLP